MKKTLLALAALTSLQGAPALADNYEVNLTRKGSNVYKVDGKDIIIQTRHCYIYAYSEEAIFKTSGYGGEVIFFDSKDKCDVKAVFGVSKQKPGKYVVTVSLDDDDWFGRFDTHTISPYPIFVINRPWRYYLFIDIIDKQYANAQHTQAIAAGTYPSPQKTQALPGGRGRQTWS